MDTPSVQCNYRRTPSKKGRGHCHHHHYPTCDFNHVGIAVVHHAMNKYYPSLGLNKFKGKSIYIYMVSLELQSLNNFRVFDPMETRKLPPEKKEKYLEYLMFLK